MGIIQSVFCSIIFCVERVLTWTCCAFLLMLLMFTIIVLMVYGISVGYHYAQKELASFAMSSRTTTEETIARRAGGDSRPIVRLVAVNRTEVEHAPQPILEVQRSARKQGGEKVYLETSVTPVIVLETERPPKEPELSPHERELARRLIGRYRRSRNNVTLSIPFFRPLNSSEPTLSPIAA
ncbi:uncharacterized protein LOC123696356 isoform X1 [Colias croceus]|uniref:uncharacterized protein LOC123696356 isoform X1 n=2 Tax=Colias crocea TaxID=72248 RepID=UPI001E27B2EC|nr:uncharacterized protein LOC123696356 isoform X1 [Colias croceus]